MATTERSLIGKNIIITGDISATEDLVVEGRVTGKILLNESRLTVGEEGYLQSHITAREVSSPAASMARFMPQSASSCATPRRSPATSSPRASSFIRMRWSRAQSISRPRLP